MKSHFFVKLIPPRSTFPADITPEETAIMQQHAVYWGGLMKQGKVHVFGPVLDPEGVFGMAVVSAENAAEVHSWLAGDPAAVLMTAEVSPMKAVLSS